MSYKLQKYEEDVCSRLMCLYDTQFELAVALSSYKHFTPHFNAPVRTLAMYIWSEIKELDGGYLADFINTEFPNYTTKDIIALVRHAIKKTFGHTISDLISLVKWDGDFYWAEGEVPE